MERYLRKLVTLEPDRAHAPHKDLADAVNGRRQYDVPLSNYFVTLYSLTPPKVPMIKSRWNFPATSP